MRKNCLLKLIAFALSGLLLTLVMGCDANDPFDVQDEYDPFATSKERVDNSVYLGQFEVTLSIGDCEPKTITYVIHQFWPYRALDNHLYIHIRNNQVEYDGVNSDLGEFLTEVEIADKTIMVNETVTYYDEETEEKRTSIRYFDFADDYNSFALSGEIVDPLTGNCQGEIRGIGKRIVVETEEDDSDLGTGTLEDEEVDIDADDTETDVVAK
jgi:hypothetical protein